MMQIVLERFACGLDTTLGRLYVPGELACFTIEDEIRAVKVMHETAIPEGTYELELRREGGFHQRYSERFGLWHRGMIWLKDVPSFEWILIHIGNFAREGQGVEKDDTSGCILVGERPEIDEDAEFEVLSSTSAYRRIYPVIADGIEREGCEIRITNRVRELAA